MGRLAKIRKNIDKSKKGIEIGPFHSPIAPKSEGFQTTILDFQSKDELIKKVKEINTIDPSALNLIEDVDVVGSASEIYELIQKLKIGGDFNFIISPHNFEHIPNPVKFLQGCSKLLESKGHLSMIIPDKRVTFDYFRPLSHTGSFIEAFLEGRDRPTPSKPSSKIQCDVFTRMEMRI
jgi:hypothetical protein